MHTTCPECSSVFRVTAEQLNAAHGQVRCGYCQNIFDALGSLEEDWKDNLPEHEENYEHVLIMEDELLNEADISGPSIKPQVYQDDEDLPLDEILTDNYNPPHAGNDTDSAAPNLDPAPPVDEPSALAELQTGNHFRQEPRYEAESEHQEALDISKQAEALFGKLEKQIRPSAMQESTEQRETIIAPSASTLEHDELEDVIANDRDIINYVLAAEKAEGPDSEVSPQDIPTDDTPHILRDELAAITGEQHSRHTFAWITGIMLLSACLLLQGLYYFRDSLARDENFRDMIIVMCDILACDVPLRNDAAQGKKTIIMRSHAITPIAGQDDRLRIAAIFTNMADYPQAYPLLQIKMTNESQKVTAMRRFQPHEYLAPHIDIKNGLPARTSVEVFVDIIKPQSPVISYQLDFL